MQYNVKDEGWQDHVVFNYSSITHLYTLQPFPAGAYEKVQSVPASRIRRPENTGAMDDAYWNANEQLEAREKRNVAEMLCQLNVWVYEDRLKKPEPKPVKLTTDEYTAYVAGAHVLIQHLRKRPQSGDVIKEITKHLAETQEARNRL